MSTAQRLLSTAGLALLLSNASCGGGARADHEQASAVVAESTAPFVAVEPAPAPAAPGSASAPGPVRHAYAQASVEVRSDTARVVVTEVFVNDSDAEVKLSYRFPLPNDATVAGFADFRDGRRIEATAAGREEARREFERAQAEGKTAGLTETDGPLGFRTELTALAPRESRRVELTYVQTLRPLGGERTFVYPAAAPGNGPARLFELDLALTATRPIAAVEIPNQRDARVLFPSPLTARAAVERSFAPLDRDLVVRWSESSEPLDLAARAVRRGADEPAYVEARFSFTKDTYLELAPPRDVVFVVDASLSMSGDPLEKSKLLVERALANLSARDRVALVSFDAVVRGWSALAPADDATKRRVRAELAALRASGGSNLDAAIDRAHELTQASGRAVLVLATDGQPTVGEDLERLTPASPPEAFRAAQVFVALFNYPSRQKPLEALFPTVTSVYVPSGDAAEREIQRLAELASAPSIDDFHLELGGITAETQHGRVPAAVALGASVRVVARATEPVTVRVMGTLHGRPIAIERRLEIPAASAEGDPLPLEWARARIADLESEYQKGHDERLRKEIVALGTSYRLASSMTSFVAAEDSLSPDRVMPGDPEIRVRAPRTAAAVRAVLPWGETVECEWREDEEVWFGRFLVPRGVRDGLYRVRALMDFQGQTTLRTTLLFRVDSRPPQFRLTGRAEGGALRLRATAMRDVFDGRGSSIRKDRVDVKSLVVRLEGRAVELWRIDADHWGAVVALPASAGPLTAELVASDFARNTRTTRTAIEVKP